MPTTSPRLDYTELAEYPSDEWFDLHKTGLSGSDASALLGESKYRSPLTVWAEKTERETPEREDDERQYWGLRLEELLATEYEDRASRRVTRNAHLLRARAAGLSHVIGTPDGFIDADDRAHMGPGIWEAKTTGAHMAIDWEHGVPMWVRIQVHHYMLLTGCTWGSVCCLIGGQRFVWQDIDVDPELVAVLAPRLTQFWNEHVLADEPPEPGAMDEDRRVLGLLQAEVPHETMPLEGDALIIAQRYANLGVCLKEKGEERQKCANALRNKLRAEGARRAEGGGLRVVWAVNNRITVKEA
jgi:predicted phage-related endonuclease